MQVGPPDTSDTPAACTPPRRAVGYLVNLVLAACVACSPPPKHAPAPLAPPRPKPGAVTLTIIGTNDLHGALERLPLLGGYVANLRAARAADGGGVVLRRRRRHVPGHARVEPRRGRRRRARVQRARLRRGRGRQPRVRLRPRGPARRRRVGRGRCRAARSRRARARRSSRSSSSNILDAQSGARIKWPNMPPSTIVEVAGHQGRDHRREHRVDAVHDDAGELRRPRDARRRRAAITERGEGAARRRARRSSSSPRTSAASARTSTSRTTRRRATATRSCSR